MGAEGQQKGEKRTHEKRFDWAHIQQNPFLTEIWFRPRPDSELRSCEGPCDVERRAFRGSGTCGVGQRCSGDLCAFGRRALGRGKRRSLPVVVRGRRSIVRVEEAEFEARHAKRGRLSVAGACWPYNPVVPTRTTLELR